LSPPTIYFDGDTERGGYIAARDCPIDLRVLAQSSLRALRREQQRRGGVVFERDHSV
jgi:hypothetical protein